MIKSTEQEEYSDCDDEDLVATALVALLNEVSSLVDLSGVEWVLDHTSFVAKFRKGKYTAVDDGSLQVKCRSAKAKNSKAKNSNILAILEVKRKQRTKEMQSIQIRGMHETLQEQPELKHVFFTLCNSHGLQLLIKDILKLLWYSGVVKSISKIVATFKKSPLQMAILREHQMAVYGKHKEFILRYVK